MANTVQMIPERYRSTRFRASCWFHLSQNPNLAFADYQRLAKDRVCRESVFEDVKKEMALDRMFNRPDAVPLPGGDPDPPMPPPKQHPPQPAPPPNLALAAALVNGLAKATPRIPPPIIKVPTEEPETMRKENRSLKVPRTGEAQKIREWLKHQPKKVLAEMSPKEYEKMSGHKLKNVAAFYAARRVMADPSAKHSGIRPAKPARVAMASLPETKGLSITLAELPVADFKCSPKDLRDISLALVKILHPRGAEAKVVILSEPHVMEIRLPYHG